MSRLGALRSVVRRPSVERGVRVGLATAIAALVAMVIVKLGWIASVTASDLGSHQLSRERSLGNVLGWFAIDVWAALLWAVPVGVVIGVGRGRWRWVTHSLAVAAGAGLALLLLVSAVVYHLFGAPLTSQLVASLDAAGDATDSIASLATRSRVLLGASLVVLLAAIPLPLSVAMRRWRRVWIGAVGVAGLAVVTAIAGTASGSTSRFDLDRNPLTAYLESLLVDPDRDSGYVPASEYHAHLRPVAAPIRPRVDRDAYRELEKLGRHQPNVVLVLMESTAYRQMSVTHPELDTTPFLRRISQRSLFWTHYWAHTPNSIWAIYQVMCSAMPPPHSFKPTKDRSRIDCHTASELLVPRGWTAGLFHSGHFRFSQKDLFFADRGYEVLYDAHSMPDRERYVEWSWGIEEAASVDAMLAFVDDHPDQPLFLTYIPVYPHHPYHVPKRGVAEPPKSDSRSRTKYRASIRYVDSMIEKLVRGFEDRGIADNTLFIITGDHGEAFGEHPGSWAHGGHLWDEQTRTFVLWYAPGLLDAPAVDARRFGHTDILPTLLDILSIDPEPRHRGISALSHQRRPMVPMYTTHGRRFLGLIDGDYKYIRSGRTKRDELYDLSRDPREKKNLAKKHPRMVAAYRKKAVAFSRAARSFYYEIPDLPPASDRAAAITGDTHEWTVEAVDCAVDYGRVDRSGEIVAPDGKGARLVCSGPELERGDIAITGFDVIGIEALAAASINGLLAWVSPEGQRRQVAYCRLNGKPGKPETHCEPVMIPGRHVLAGGGGKFVVELQFRAATKTPPADQFAVHEAKVRYRVAR